MTRPGIRIQSLELQNLGPIQRFALPEQGLGWRGQMPGLVMLGGINGSGKSTLLEAVYALMKRALVRGAPGEALGIPSLPEGQEALFGLDLHGVPIVQAKAHLAISIGAQSHPLALGAAAGQASLFDQGRALRQDLDQFRDDHEGIYPQVFFMPCERGLQIPPTEFKSAGKKAGQQDLVYRWKAPLTWEQSLESLLYQARWQDLNAKEEGKAARAFEGFSSDFQAMTLGKKGLGWHDSELWVEVDGRPVHGLEALSSGEKQVLLLLSELRRHWTPGSLILIDEPELHLHEGLQEALLRALRSLLQERGGQLWLATQSSHMFQMAKPGETAVLGLRAPS